MLCKLQHFFGALWAGPITMLGWLVALVTWSKPMERADATVVFKLGDRLSRRLVGRWAGFCIGDTVFLVKAWPANPQVLMHELRHVSQVRLFGVFFPIFYAIGWLVAAVKWQHLPTPRPYPLWWQGFYWLNPFEVDARRAARQE